MFGHTDGYFTDTPYYSVIRTFPGAGLLHPVPAWGKDPTGYNLRRKRWEHSPIS
jgi:hypothetical protein